MSRGGVLVFGEALADLLPQDAAPTGYAAVLGGSGFNTALALARCGARVALCASLSDDALGRRFSARLAEEGIDGRFVARRAAPTPLAMVEPLGAGGDAHYRFHLAGSAFALPPALPGSLDGIVHLHLTSFAATAGDSGRTALALLRQAREAGLSVSYDLNIRPAALPEREQALRAIAERIALCDLVKASAEDVEWIAPGTKPFPAAARWLDAGPSWGLITLGAAGSLACARGSALTVRAPQVAVVDTIGAGDSFMGGLIAALAHAGGLGSTLHTLAPEEMSTALAYATRVAAASCERRGCNPPRLPPPAS